jgi:hypothetical protein
MATTKESKEKKVSLGDLTPQARAALIRELMKEQKENEEKIREQRIGYKDAVNKLIPKLFVQLKKCSEQLSDAKTRVYKELSGLVDKKSEVYNRDQDQYSHSFTTEDGICIIIGYRMNDGWDDTADVGIQKVGDYIQSLGKDANSKKLVATVMRLLSKDSKGNLKASRVLQLKKLADDIGDPAFKDAIQIIQDAYRPVRSKQFVTCRYKDETGQMKELALNIGDAQMN